MDRDLSKQLAEAEAKGVAEGLRQAQVRVDIVNGQLEELRRDHERLKRVFRALIAALLNDDPP